MIDLMITKKSYTLLIIISIIGTFLFPYGIINTMVSLKYETENAGDCISKVTGDNLCESISNFKIYFSISLVVLILLLAFKSKLVKNV